MNQNQLQMQGRPLQIASEIFQLVVCCDGRMFAKTVARVSLVQSVQRLHL